MEIKDTKKISSSKLFSMTGGEGQYSYVNNSSFQKMGLDIAKKLMQEEITKKLDIDKNIFSPPNVFRIADLGCAAGPNTFFLVQDIIDAVKSKYESEEIEFQVFFNDHSANDFNTLFRTLPVGKNYFANGAPGSFYERLFPKASLHLVHSSYAIPWLSKVPEKVQDKSSPAWNKGRILYENCKEVEFVYAAQFADDFDTFLKARAEEMVPGGLMVLLFPSVQTEANPPKCIMVTIFELVGSSLMDMAKMGLVDESKVDSFNLHLYFPSAEEVKTIVERNGSFKIEKMQQLDRLMPVIEKLALVIRAASEEVV
ncbi:hypothetical protein SLEP1_g50929 [Rubroshorea leprosula]|uniref:S-adenosylmethionine-dependent methyltransferase n=1 Tax=Rubroshorea leprosula TaxID=152421 RepID=A0AAV5M2E2_9ROSI|nr:hypothetical protein SLEP1_g50929 [Rubroshorea leprosula]